MKNLKIRTPHNTGLISLDTPKIMGILNFTPDSFSDGGKYFDKTSALKHAEEMILQGAAIIDLGAESTRPNSLRISAEEEVKRLSEILPDLRKNFPDICISVDTYKESVARYAVGEGADIVNDVFGGAFDCARDETKPVGYLNQGDFLNGAVFGTTLCTPFELLCFLKQIEKKMGRVNTFRNAPRPIDLDIIFYGEVRINMQSLKIPHSQWKERQFVYVPLRDFCNDQTFAEAFPFEREIIKVLPKSEIFAKYEM